MTPIPFIDIPALRSAAGVVNLPGSKSISNRVLLLAALSSGVTRIHDLLESDDTRVMLAALAALGCEVRAEGRVVSVQGLGGRLRTRDARLFLGNAGTAMRPLCAALAVMAAGQGGNFELSGVPRMHERPIGDLVDALQQLGCNVQWLGKPGYPPLRIGAAPAALRSDAPIRVRGDVSSQFLSALLLALPLVGSSEALTIQVEGELISRPYVEITLKLLARFGIQVQVNAWQSFVIPAGSAYRSPGEIHVEGDASAASYFIALGAIAATHEALRIRGVGDNSIQGDMAFVDCARAMGADIVCGPAHIDVRRGVFPLRAISIDCNHIPDAAMTLAVMALFAVGSTRLTNIASWRVKETDRIAAMAAELRKCGAGVVEGADFIEVTPPQRWHAAAIHTYDDHRIAMCFSLAACNGLAPPGDAVARAVPVRILDPQCVAKTFPEYFDTLFSVVRAHESDIPVITVDGPTASGKGTLASALAQQLGYHFLDSGAAYRATALCAMRAGVAADNEAGLSAIAASLNLLCLPGQTRIGAEDVTELLRLEEVGALASKISSWPRVRDALRQFQLQHRRIPGLVADGRDMGTVIFPGADLKVFLTASAATRAERRHKQLISKGFSANIADLRAELEARDERDQSRLVSPLKPAQDAMLLDNSALSVEASVDAVLSAWQQRRPFG